MSPRVLARVIVPFLSWWLAACGGASTLNEPATVSISTPVGATRTLEVAPPGPAQAPKVERMPVVWHPKGEEEAIRRLALSRGRPLVVRFFATWSVACRELDKTMATPAVVAELERFETVLVDASDDDDPETTRLVAKYRVLGLPTIVVLDGAGKEAVRIKAYADVPALLAKLQPVQAR